MLGPDADGDSPDVASFPEEISEVFALLGERYQLPHAVDAGELGLLGQHRRVAEKNGIVLSLKRSVEKLFALFDEHVQQLRGGRGVATGFGALLFIATPAWLGSVVAFMLALAITRMVSVGSLAAVAGAVVGYVLFVLTGYLSFNSAVFGFILIAGSIVTIRHRPNIARIIRGSEPRIGQRRSPST